MSANNVITVDFRRNTDERTADELNVTTVNPKAVDAQQLSSTPARLEDIYGGSEPNTMFVATAHGPFRPFPPPSATTRRDPSSAPAAEPENAPENAPHGHR